ncbi:MAG TPA: FAD-binding and (Fe-S)-binding domain-containing protein [Kofleriaceae bacterium]|nr:FAD-binding and (Fe-S)-binding domain-containing protein [Kofleriaceae bacterium]
MKSRPDRSPDGELARALAHVVRGEVRFDTATRAVYAHDASNYRQVPIGVVLPRDAADVEATIATCREHGAPVLSRGGGTSLAGQCVNAAVVMDFSKYMGAVVDVDVEGRRVRVQPGCVLDRMRGALAPHGLTYGPDPATHNHCTLGGMLGNDSCGIHSVMAEMYGPGARTADHVEALEIVTYDGLRLRVGATPEDELARIIAAGGRRGDIYRRLRDLRDRHAERIRARFAPIPRRVSGYNLDELLPERGFHVARALVGSEATCVTILEATLQVYPERPGRAVVLLGYPDVFAAGDHVPALRAFRPVGLEGFDDRLIADVEATGLHAGSVKLLPPGKGWLLVELGEATRAQALDAARHLMDALRREPGAPSMKLFEDEHEAERIWKLREAGLGATAFVPGRHDFWPGWEDSAVPPDRVGAYLRDLRALLDRHHLDAALYGHLGQGCIHCRIDFRLESADGREAYARFTRDAAELVVRHGGSLSGEHGDGQARGDLLAIQFGDELVRAFREFKAIWDPDGRMNPGKKVDGLRRTEHLKLAVYQPAPHPTTFHPTADGGDFRHAALRCVGVGECRRDHGGTMCPSFRVTHDELHTTRGRARALFEMMQGDVVQDGWASEAVKETLDLCLACKGCKGDCPVKVDVATYKSEFLSHYHEHHRRPRHAYAMGWIHRWARLGGHVPWLANAVTQTPGLRRLAAWLGGLAPERPIPRFAPVPFRRWFARRAARVPDGRPVILWADTFNNHFIPSTLVAAVEVLEHAGYRVTVPREPLCCGRALYDYGMLPLAKRLWHRTMAALGPDVARGVPIVGLEPSCVSAFRDELPQLFPDDAVAQQLAQRTFTLAELLVRDDARLPSLHGRAVVHGHCHQKAVLDWGAERKVLAGLGLELDVLEDAGCCGLAGSFGYEREHYDISMAIGEQALLPAVRAAGDAIAIADGFSCREQIQHATGRPAYHLAEVLYAALDEPARAGRAAPAIDAGGRQAPGPSVSAERA